MSGENRENQENRFIIPIYRFLFGNDGEHPRHIFEYPQRITNYLLRFFRGKTTISEADIKRPNFSTNIFNDREEHEAELQENWFWLFIALAIFCLGVAASYFLINYR